MKVKVKKEFLDRYTGLIRKPGEVLEITEARLREIRRSGDYVEVVQEKEKAPEAKEKK